MPWTKTLAARHSGKKGNFANSRNGLLSLFSNHPGHVERSWRETFGYERRPEKPNNKEPFIAREAPKSSSDSK